MRFQLTAVGLACATLLAACGGGGEASGSKAQSIDFPYPGARYLVTAPAPLLATTNSGLPITFTSNTPATCAVAGGNLVPVKPGECSITASQAGDSTYAAADAQQLINILKHVQAITFASPGFQAIDGTPPPLVATSDSGLAVSFASTTPATCTVSGTTLTLVAKGECSLTASQAGSDDYEVAPPKMVTFRIDDAPPPVLTFLSGYQSTGLTIEGGKVGTFAGSNKDGWWCSDPNWCSSSISADGSNIKMNYLIQPKDPAHPNTDTWIGGYIGLEIFGPGITDFNKTGNTTEGVQVGKQTTLKLNLAQNAEWFSTAAKDIKVSLQLGHFALKGGNACNVSYNTVFTPSSAAATSYELQLSSFTGVSEDCGLTGLVPATELATYPIVRIKIESANGANTSASSTPEPDPTYRSEITLTGGITVQ